jgi:hypothetical protein
MKQPLKGWRYGIFIGGIVGAIGAAIYPVIISPYLFPEKWKKQSKEVDFIFSKKKRV